MELGSIWGHGGYVAPDWSADWVHREAMAVLDLWAGREAGVPYAGLNADRRAGLAGQLQEEIRRNTYDPATRTITLDADRASAIKSVSAHYESLFGDDPATAELRESYAMRNGTIADAANRHSLTAFFWWTA